jgi:hypothetical protein
MSIRQKTIVPRRKEKEALSDATANRSKPSKVTNFSHSSHCDTHAIDPPKAFGASLVLTALFAACAAAVFGSLSWTRGPSQFPLLFNSPEPHETDPAFIVRDLPGKGKGMVAVRDIRVGIPGI